MKLFKTLSVLMIMAAFSANAQETSSIPAGSKGSGPLEGGIRQTPGLCGIFHRWGFVGDSLCSGEFEAGKADGKTRYLDIYPYSWGQRMCAYMGATGDNYSQGGETAKGWIDHFWDNPKNKNNNIDAKADPKQAYIVALAANDSRKYQAGDPDADICKEDYTKNNAETFAGNYAGIIQRLKSIQPDAKFFLVTPANDRIHDEFSAVIRRMPEFFSNVYLIDLAKYGADYKDKDFRAMYFNGGHMNAMGYEYAAWQFLNYIDWIIRNNPSEFIEAGFIGTTHSFEGAKKFFNKLPGKPSSETDFEEFKLQYKKNKADWDAAYEFLSRTDLMTIEPGKYPLTDSGCYANVQETKTANEAKKEEKYERHRKFIDIQYLLDGEELIYVSDLESMEGMVKEYNPEKDVEFFKTSKNPRKVVMNAQTCVIAFPDEPHRPGLAPDGKPAKIRKVVVKIPYID